MSDAQTITREELYRLVWAQPISKLAPTYGISDVGLSKLCKRNNIPLPPRGYWEKLRHGKPVKRIPLPSVSLSQSIDKKITITPTAKAPEEVLPQDIYAAVTKESSAGYLLPVPDNIRKHHVLVQEEIARVKNRRPYSYNEKKRIDETDHRLWRVMTTLFSAFERRQWAVQVDESWGYVITILGQKIKLAFDEKYAQRRIQRSPEELRKSSYMTHDTIHEPTGKLRIRMQRINHYSLREWIDTTTARLEDKLNTIIVEILSEVAIKRAEEIKRVELERQRAEEQLRAWKAEERRRAEQKRIDSLIREVDQWYQATRIRTFVKACQEQGDRDPEWCAWALKVADRIDPME